MASLTACVLLTASLCAEEAVMAWHLAGSADLQYQGTAIAEPPFTTVFAERGDRLMDLTPAFREQLKGAEELQVIWNETRGNLIARGHVTSLARVEQVSGFLKQPLQTRVTVSWYQSILPGDAVPTGKEPVASIATVSRFGGESISELAAEGTPLSSLSLEVKPQSRGDSGTSLCYWIRWGEPTPEGNLHWSLDGGISSNDLKSTPTTIAQVASPSGKPWTLALSTRRELVDGTPVAQAIRTETAGKIVMVQRPVGPPKMIGRGTAKVKDADFLLAEMECPQALITALFTPASPDGKTDPDDLPFSGLPDAVVPEELWSFARGPLIDCRKIFPRGGDHRDSDLIGYSPQTGRILVASRVREAIDGVDFLLTNGCFLETKAMSIHLKDAGRKTDVLLAGSSGQKVTLQCENDDEEVVFSTAVEAVIGDNDTAMDLSYDLQMTKGSSRNPAKPGGKLLLPVGRKINLQSTRPDGVFGALTGKAEIFIGLEHR